MIGKDLAAGVSLILILFLGSSGTVLAERFTFAPGQVHSETVYFPQVPDAEKVCSGDSTPEKDAGHKPPFESTKDDHPIQATNEARLETAEAGTKREDWKWRRASPAEYAGIAIGVAGTLYSEAEYGEPSRPSWTAHNGFDQSIRSGLRLGSNSARDAVGNLGDVLMGLLIAEPVIDSFATLGYRDHRWDALLQTSVVNLESFTFTALVSSVMENSTRRQKPYLQSCPNASCGNDQANRSMPSGHTAFAFTGAGLYCTNHTYQSLYADPDLERNICAASLMLAGVDGVARVMADQHYATDVIAGSAIGLFSGFVLPRLLHYYWPNEETKQRPKNSYEDSLVKHVSFSPQVLSGGGILRCDLAF